MAAAAQPCRFRPDPGASAACGDASKRVAADRHPVVISIAAHCVKGFDLEEA
jgi:hypothetical protein